MGGSKKSKAINLITRLFQSVTSVLWRQARLEAWRPALGLVAGWVGLRAVFLASTAVVLCAALVALRLMFMPVKPRDLAGAGSLQPSVHAADVDAMETF